MVGHYSSHLIYEWNRFIHYPHLPGCPRSIAVVQKKSFLRASLVRQNKIPVLEGRENSIARTPFRCHKMGDFCCGDRHARTCPTWMNIYRVQHEWIYILEMKSYLPQACDIINAAMANWTTDFPCTYSFWLVRSWCRMNATRKVLKFARNDPHPALLTRCA
jgi:hypothetical protein